MDLLQDPFLQKHQLKATEYRARAREGFAAAESTTLDRVREQHLASAGVWADMAHAEEVLVVARRTLLTESAE